MKGERVGNRIDNFERMGSHFLDLRIIFMERKTTSGKTFVRFSHSISDKPYDKKMTEDFKAITMGNVCHVYLR